MENSEDTPRGPGVYALILEITRDIVVKVGSLGTLKFEKGFYIYIGSARGPGGLRTRLTRHVRGPARIKWHIDYITSRDDVKGLGVGR
jgi:Uri superfamily endonuclease